MAVARLENNLGRVRRFRNLTQEQVAKDTGISVSTLRKYEQGVTSPNASTLLMLADYYRVNTDTLLYPNYPLPGQKLRPSTGTVPIVGRIAAGDPREAFEGEDGRWYVPDPILEDHPKAFYLVVGGDSMDRIVPEGSLVLIDPDVEVVSGDVAAVLVNGFDATLKRVYFAGDTIVLHPESHNPEHRDRTIDVTDPDAPYFRVVGKCITYTAPEGWRA